MKLSAKQLAAVMKAGLIMTNADGKVQDEELKIIINELKSFNVSAEQGKLLYEVADAMSVDEMVEQLKPLSLSDKKYICGYLVAIIVVDGDVDDNEAQAWKAISTLCDFPEMTAAEALAYWRNN